MSGAALAGLALSGDTIARLHCYEALLRKWTPTINLVSAGTLESLWQRHFEDSAQLFVLRGDSAGHWCDLGSGGGFPGMVNAIIAAELAPSSRFTLVESDRRKAAFLRNVSRETGVPVTVETTRAEDLTLEADIISARAFAPLSRLLPMAAPLLGAEGRLLLMKGAQHARELTAARDDWHMMVQQVPSRTDPSGAILIISELSRI